MEATSHGTLSLLWNDGARPKVADRLVSALYDNIRKPIAIAGIKRLYAAWAKTCQRPALDFNRYWDGLIEFKKSVGQMALPDMEAVDTALNEIHDKFIDGTIGNGMERYCNDLIRDLGKISLKSDDVGFDAARLQCIAYDDSDALLDFGNRFISEKCRAALFDAELGEPGGAQTLMTKTWIDERRGDDRQQIHDAVLRFMIAPEAQNRRRLAETMHHVKPAENGESDLRRLGMHCVAA